MTQGQTLQLWCVDLVAAAPSLHAVEQRTPRLSADERQRAMTFSDRAVREEWLAAQIALRLLIELSVGRRWRAVPFVREARGKPRLEGAPLAFSLSHAPGVALIGIAGDGSVGVDIERARKVRIDAARRARIIEAGEAIGEAPLSPDDAGFLQAWVRLEALAKADGCGIGRLLTRLGILGVARNAAASVDVRARIAEVLREAPAVRARDLQLGEGICAAVACAAVSDALAVRWLPDAAEALEKLVN